MKTSVLLPLLGLLLVGCATAPEIGPRSRVPEIVEAEHLLKQARKKTGSLEDRAGFYLAAAEQTVPFALSGEPARGRAIYNNATAELTELLREPGSERYWNQPSVALAGPMGTYRLRFAPAVQRGMWAPAYFDSFIVARSVGHRNVRRWVEEPGVGGTLVGVRAPPGGRSPTGDRFAPRGGYHAPVTAMLEFGKRIAGVREATLALHDPKAKGRVPLAGRSVPLAADLSAPLASFPVRSEFILGLIGMLFADRIASQSGLYHLEPYDAERIPVLLIHGLLSTPQMWLNVANEMDADPELRGRFQYWAYWYPTGVPMAYSSLKLREDLAEVQRRFHPPRGLVLIGHSMGGLLARMQATDTGRVLWDANFQDEADKLYATLPPDGLVKRALIFRANPQVKREVFICTPHRGSGLAIGSIGNLGRKLAGLPAALIFNVQQTLGAPVEALFGKGGRLPTSIDSLSPKSPTLRALNTLPIRAPHHSIIGDRGRGDSPESSDGVVPYASSHLASAESELIVPGPHGGYQLQQSVAELRRVLKLHLQTAR